MSLDPTQFLGLPSPGIEHADILLLPTPLEKTVSYGRGTGGGPAAIIAASLQVETFDEETLLEFAESPRLHTLPPLQLEGTIEDCLTTISDYVKCLPHDKFLLALGGEHTATLGLLSGLAARTAAGFDFSELTIVQLDAHADLAERLDDGLAFSHGTVMRRLWEKGCRLVQIGVRSLNSDEYKLITTAPRIATFFAHCLEEKWPLILETLAGLKGLVYLSIDLDALDVSLMPSTGTPLPGGLSWRQTMELIHVLTANPSIRLIAADLVEYVPSPTSPGSDPTAARLAMKLMAWWWKGRKGGAGWHSGGLKA